MDTEKIGGGHKKDRETNAVNRMVIHIANSKAKDMANKKHHPPAYYRYRENRPTNSIVLTKEIKNLLDIHKRDAAVSYSQLVKRFVDQAYDLAP